MGLKSFHTSEDITEWKGNLLNERKYLQSNYLKRGQYSKYGRNFYNSVTRKIQFKNGQKKWIDLFTKKDIKLTNKYMKRCSTLPIITEMQIKTTLRYHLTLIRMTIMKKNLQIISAGEGVDTRESSYTMLINPEYSLESLMLKLRL